SDDHTLQEYLLDLGYGACLGLLAYALLRLSKSQILLSQSKMEWAQYHNINALTAWLFDKFSDPHSRQDADTPWLWAHWLELLIVTGIPMFICICFAGRPVRIGLAVIGLCLACLIEMPKEETVIYENRSFFSVQRVKLDKPGNNKTYRVLVHGGIDHGRQDLDPATRDRPISYFLPSNPIGQVFSQMKEQDALMPPDKRMPFAVVGLGVGTLASYANRGQTAHIYEIDPAVLKLSGYELNENGKLTPHPTQEPIFYYLHDAINRGVKLDLFLGDGRLKLNEEKIKDEKKNLYQVIVLDAFSSDAIPVHLLTKEAIQMYLTKLRPDGILVFNITNRYVSMAPVLADAARELDLVCLQQADWGEKGNPESFGTDWVIMFQKKDTKKWANEGELFTAAVGGVPWAAMGSSPQMDWPYGLPLRLDPAKWNRQKDTGRPAWTDSYQDLMRALNFGTQEPVPWYKWLVFPVGMCALIGGISFIVIKRGQ
ncbi:MAG TPA: hypothetical protein VE988_11235, partial [Gemmataceae bacterium]|nr:hypothetical protein [Gemmataceae bacterium]